MFRVGGLLSLASGSGYEDELTEKLNEAARTISGTPRSMKIDRDREKQTSLVWRSVQQEEGRSSLSPLDQSAVWSGHKVLLSDSLEIEAGTKQALQAAILRGGGILQGPSDDFDILVTMYAEGEDYVRVSNLQ